MHNFIAQLMGGEHTRLKSLAADSGVSTATAKVAAPSGRQPQRRAHVRVAELGRIQGQQQRVADRDAAGGVAHQCL